MALSEDDIRRHIERLIAHGPERAASAERPRETFAIERHWVESPRYIGLEVRVNPRFAGAYTRPGQYVTFQLGERAPRYLAISSAPAPDAKVWEFLVDRGSEIGACFDPPGQPAPRTVRLSMPEGPGFPGDMGPERTALMFTTGSGIAAIRPVLDYWQRRPDKAPGSVALYYGEASAGDFAYVDALERWRDNGVRVFQAVGDRDDTTPGYRFVQHAFEADRPALDQAWIFFSGSALMLRSVADLLLRKGVSPARLLTNY